MDMDMDVDMGMDMGMDMDMDMEADMDMEGGHFRSGIPAERSRQRGLELGFLVAALREKIA